jgi:hypothetical protein
MRAYITLQMDRPIDSDKHYISPGGYEVMAGGKNYQFDFNESYGSIDKERPDVISFELRDEDYDSFPDIKELREHLHEITELVECYVYTGENGEPEINPLKILSFCISDSGTGKRSNLPESTEYITCTPYVTDHNWTIDYEMTDRLIGGYDFEK